MPEIKAADALWSGAEAQPKETVRFLKMWHGSLGDGLIAVTPLDSRTGAAGHTVIQLWDQIAAATGGKEGLEPMIWLRKGGPYNLYHSVGLLKARPKRGRGKKDDIDRLPGLWLDLDVGSGKFDSEHDCWEALRKCSRVGLCPSVIVGSGSGGLHGYWIVDGGLDGGTAEQMNLRLRAWLTAETGVALDNVSSREHIMRLPGSVRWPKKGEERRHGAACLVRWADPVRRLSADQLTKITEQAWTAEEAAHTSRRTAFALEDIEAISVLMRGGNDWGRLYRIAFFEQLFAERWSWERVLEPHGWTLILNERGMRNGAPDEEGRRTWTRPGGVTPGKAGVNLRSLQTDWFDSPDYATLKSKCVDTGLMRLVDAGVKLSKFRVWLELSEWHGDLVSYMRRVADGTATELC